MISKMKEYLEAQIAQTRLYIGRSVQDCDVTFDEGRINAYKDALRKLNELFPSYQTNIIKRDEVVKLAHDVNNMQEDSQTESKFHYSPYQEGRSDAFVYVGNRLGEILNNGD